jgi:hypothetical protein
MAQRKKHMIDIVAVARLGGIALNRSLTPEQRSESARRAINARWKKYRAEKRRLAKRAKEVAA